jgi:membrane protease YdiL (CAAX protease family)
VSEAGSPGRRVGIYLLLTVTLSSFFWFLIIRSGALGGNGGRWVLGLMWCPGAAALLASLLTRRPFADIGWRWSWKWALLAYALPVAYAGVAYGATWALGLGAFPNPAFLTRISDRFGGAGASEASVLLRYVFFQGSVGVLVACVSGLGEEIGWRGFLVPELARRMPFARVAFWSGAIWAVWHYPILLFADYHGGTPAWYGLACFTVMVLGIGVVFAWSRLASGSVWPAAILHGSHNLWVQQVFDPLTADTGRTRWVIGEFGAALAIVALGTAWLVLRRRADAPAAAAESVGG